MLVLQVSYARKNQKHPVSQVRRRHRRVRQIETREFQSESGEAHLTAIRQWQWQNRMRMKNESVTKPVLVAFFEVGYVIECDTDRLCQPERRAT